MRVNLVAAALAVIGSVVLASEAASARTTAGEVVDDATLKAFVDGAAADIAAITNLKEGAKLLDGLRAEGDWKSGSMFLIVLLRNGDTFIHGNDRSAESKNLLDVEDENGLKVVAELLAAGAQGGGLNEAASQQV